MPSGFCAFYPAYMFPQSYQMNASKLHHISFCGIAQCLVFFHDIFEFFLNCRGVWIQVGVFSNISQSYCALLPVMIY